MTAPPPARTLHFGASATASLLVKMTIIYGMSERFELCIGITFRNPHPRHHFTSRRSPEIQGRRAGVGGD